MIKKITYISALFAIILCFSQANSTNVCRNVRVIETKSFTLSDYVALTNNFKLYRFDEFIVSIQQFDNEMIPEKRLIVVLSEGDVEGNYKAWNIFSRNKVSFESIKVLKLPNSAAELRLIFYEDESRICEFVKTFQLI